MPILWRYAIQSYLRVFFLSVCTFIAVLLVSRFKEIARFASLSADWLKTGLFIVYQFPAILPMAIPISALIASLLLFQRLSRTYELTAFRSSGLSLATLFTPVLLISLLLGFFNFFICAKLAPFCRRESKTLAYLETSGNPLLLLQRQHLIQIKDVYLNVKREGSEVKDLILIAHNETNQRLSLLSARHLQTAGENLLGTDVAILSHLGSEKSDGFDPLIIENQASMSTSAPVLSAAMKKNRPKIETHALDLKMLQLKGLEGKKAARSSHFEILRRISISLAVFSFTFLGCAFGIEQGRSPSKKNLIYALGLTLIALISYLLGKELKSSSLFAFSAFLFPHLLIGCTSCLKIRRISRGFG